MITKITMKGVASYVGETSIETDKKVNLLYGLNGTGKSTVSNYLYDLANPDYSDCSVEGLSDQTVLVYNNSFVRDYFFEEDRLRGIFTLSKDNATAEEAIRAETTALKADERRLQLKAAEIDKAKTDYQASWDRCRNEIWKIKTTFTGGDRVLEFCLDGLKGNKDKLFEHVIAVSKLDEQPEKTIEDLRLEAESLSGSVSKVDSLPRLDPKVSVFESDALLSTAIVGKEDSVVAGLIKELENSDWVKEGLKYVKETDAGQAAKCPFCQHETITEEVIASIQDYFDESYARNVEALRVLHESYKLEVEGLASLEDYLGNSYILEKESDFKLSYQRLVKLLEDNLTLLKSKLKSPSQIVTLKSVDGAVSGVNLLIDEANSKITEHNKKIENKEEALAILNEEFWKLMRWDYDQTISLWAATDISYRRESKKLSEQNQVIEREIVVRKNAIREHQGKTVNIDEAVTSINLGLSDLGIDSFKVEKTKGNLYRIVRPGDDVNDFHTLSEGEKTIITFLYFMELCRGRKAADEVVSNKIAVIDDPISSLSHVFVFHVGRKIINHLFNSNLFSQVFVLTHSLYFFYELTDVNHDRRKKNQALFRISKNSDGSRIQSMKYEEIQNDYQAYWSIINDPDQPPALIANCMRNIVEYFFAFVGKKDLNNVFRQEELSGDKYQAFCRFMNRESHSIGQNVFDFKEFRYDDFKEGLRLVFEACSFGEHYEAMCK